MNKLLLLLAVVSVGLSASAQIAFKTGMSRPSVQAALASPTSSLFERVLTVGTSPGVVAGFALYALSAVLWILVLAKVDLSVAYPIVGLGFVVTMVAGHLLFGEPLTLMRVAGTLLVCVGIVLVTSTAR